MTFISFMAHLIGTYPPDVENIFTSVVPESGIKCMDKRLHPTYTVGCNYLSMSLISILFLFFCTGIGIAASLFLDSISVLIREIRTIGKQSLYTTVFDNTILLSVYVYFIGLFMVDFMDECISAIAGIFWSGLISTIEILWNLPR